MANNDPRAFWEWVHLGLFDKHLDEFEQDYQQQRLSDESIGLFLAEDIHRDLNDLANGIYARENAYVAQNHPPLPHDLAARYLRGCATALQRLADLEQRRAEQGGQNHPGDPSED